MDGRSTNSHSRVGHVQRRPCVGEREDTERQSLVALDTSKLGKLHAPVQSAEERKDDSSVGDLETLKVLEELNVHLRTTRDLSTNQMLTDDEFRY